jgi:hypothetical protein
MLRRQTARNEEPLSEKSSCADQLISLNSTFKTLLVYILYRQGVLETL